MLHRSATSVVPRAEWSERGEAPGWPHAGNTAALHLTSCWARTVSGNIRTMSLHVQTSVWSTGRASMEADVTHLSTMTSRYLPLGIE